jgi:hypothetical protein
MSDFPVVRLETNGDIGVIISTVRRSNAFGPGVSEGIIDA